MGRVYKWNWTMCVCMYVRHPFENDHYICSYASQTPMTRHILKAYDEGYSKIIRGHEYKDKDNDKDNDKDKNTDKVPENLTYAIFLKSWWLTHSKCDDISHPGHPVHTIHPGYPVPVIRSVLQGRVYHLFGIFFYTHNILPYCFIFLSFF